MARVKYRSKRKMSGMAGLIGRTGGAALTQEHIEVKLQDHLNRADLATRCRALKRIHVSPLDLRIDSRELAVIVDDLRSSGGVYTPRVNWVVLDSGRSQSEVDDGRPYLDDAFSEAAVEERMSTMEKMLTAWIGNHRHRIDADTLMRYAQYIIPHDPLRLWPANVVDTDLLARYTIADLGSIVDMNIICSYSSLASRPRNLILEIGGGYGRLAEAMLNVFGGTIKYVLVDSVPGSLLYARDYLRRACPGSRIGFYYDGDPFDVEKFDCYIVPSWRFRAANNAAYDIAINVESFQEMGQEQVDTYLGWFEEFTGDASLIYISNAHDYRFRGRWNYPPTWQRLLCTRIPRAWTPDHRTEVFVKGNSDYTSANLAVMAAYRWNRAQAEQGLRAMRPGALARALWRNPKHNAATALLRMRQRARARIERRQYELAFERAVAGDAVARHRLTSYWARESMVAGNR